LWVTRNGNNGIEFTEKAKDVKWNLTPENSSNGAYYAIVSWKPSIKNLEEAMNTDQIEATKEDEQMKDFTTQPVKPPISTDKEYVLVGVNGYISKDKTSHRKDGD
jgi:hypothetical protein